MHPCVLWCAFAGILCARLSVRVVTDRASPGLGPPVRAGIGPEISEAVKKIFTAAKAPIEWDVQIIGKEVDPRTNSFVSRENLDSVLVRLERRSRKHLARGRLDAIPGALLKRQRRGPARAEAVGCTSRAGAGGCMTHMSWTHAPRNRARCAKRDHHLTMRDVQG